MDNKNSVFNSKLTVKGLCVLLMFSFVATIIGFSVAYIENKNYRALTAKYDQAIEKVSDLEMSVSALMSTSVYYPANTTSAYPAENLTEAITTTLSEAELSSYPDESSASQSNTENTKQTSEQSATATATSGTYYVTQSGKKYHISSCSYLSKSKIAITTDRIKAEGYSPCSRCIK